MSNLSKCECGRSPTGNCMGWHKLSEIDYKKRLDAYNSRKILKK